MYHWLIQWVKFVLRSFLCCFLRQRSVRSSSSAAASTYTSCFQKEWRQLWGQHRVRLLGLSSRCQLDTHKKSTWQNGICLVLSVKHIIFWPPGLHFTYPLLSAKVLHSHLELPLFLPGLCDGCLVLLLICHGYYGQDEVDQVEGAQEDD